jgi:hypothetical protein
MPMSEIIFVVEEAPEGGLIARGVGESIFTQAAISIKDRSRSSSVFITSGTK